MARGFKTGGRVKGSKNRATLEREAATQIDAAIGGKQELAKDTLVRMMRLAEGAAAVHRTKINDDEKHWDRFGEWFDRWAYVAKEAAKYQSPQMRAIAVMAPAPAAPPEKRDNVVQIDDPVALARVYQRRITAAR
jgi:hypothetical protein